MTRLSRALYSSVFAGLFTGLLVTAGETQWSQFRGPNGSGIDTGAGYPFDFSPSKNVVWKKSIPYGQSSPVVAGGHVYLTASDKDRLLTLCFDAKSGLELWRKEMHREQLQKIFRTNDPASPTPVADESGVVAFFPDFGLIAYTPQGKERWTLPLGPFKNFYGMAASPILAGDVLVLVCDQQSGSFIIALDRATGHQRWKTERPAATVGWATPMVFRPSEGSPQLIVLGSTRLDSYFLDTGEPRWWMPIGSMGGVGTPVASGDNIVVSTESTSEPWMPTFEATLDKYDKDKDGRLSKEEFSLDKELGEHFGWIDTDGDNFISAAEWNFSRSMGIGEFGAVAIKPGKTQGKLDAQAVSWRFKKNLPFIPAPLVYQDVFYMVRDGGIFTSLDAKTGALLKEGRSREALGEYYASPVAADSKVFIASTEGKVSVIKAGGDWEVLRVNDLGEEIHATPALSEGRIYVRTHDSLYCFGASR
jgi:outer membrane protein assembly factor BamB